MRPAHRVVVLALSLGITAMSCASGPPSGGSTHLVPTRAGAPRLADLAAGRWTVGPKSLLGPIDSPDVVWDGHELLEFGGPFKLHLSGGARYDPKRTTWRPTPKPPEPLQLSGGAFAWTGRDLFVLGTQPERNWLSASVAGLYNPAANAWRTTAPPPFSGLSEVAALRTGREVLVAGVAAVPQRIVKAALYDADRNRWRRVELIASNPVEKVVLAATRNGVLLWLLWVKEVRRRGGTVESKSGVDIYRLNTDHAWKRLPWSAQDDVSPPEQAGGKLLLAPAEFWCGGCPGPAPFGLHGNVVDSATLQLTPLPRGPLDDTRPQFLWSGRVVVALNRDTLVTRPTGRVVPGDIAFFDPTTSVWRRGVSAPKQPASNAVWVHDRLLGLALDGSVLSYRPR